MDETYGAGGALLWRYTGNSSDPNQRAYVTFNGGVLAEYWSGGTLFDHQDELGSIKGASDYTGNNFSERLFYPYGELWTGIDLNGFNAHQSFARQADYDAEIDMYNNPHRHYSPTGRFPTPDPGGIQSATLADPQTWNRYAYARNNPTTLEDPSGLEPTLLTAGGFDSANGVIEGSEPQGTDATSGTPPDNQTNGGSNHTTLQETQGNKQKLIAAQDAARKDSRFKPKELTGPDGKKYHLTFCNMATESVAKAMGASTKPFTGNANTDAQNLATSSNYRAVTPDQAQSLANGGALVISAWQNPNGPGHLATVRPEGVPGDSPPAGGKGPLLNDIGAFDTVHNQNYSYPGNANVIYYTPTGP